MVFHGASEKDRCCCSGSTLAGQASCACLSLPRALTCWPWSTVSLQQFYRRDSLTPLHCRCAAGTARGAGNRRRLRRGSSGCQAVRCAGCRCRGCGYRLRSWRARWRCRHSRDRDCGAGTSLRRGCRGSGHGAGGPRRARDSVALTRFQCAGPWPDGDSLGYWSRIVSTNLLGTMHGVTRACRRIAQAAVWFHRQCCRGFWSWIRW